MEVGVPRSGHRQLPKKRSVIAIFTIGVMFASSLPLSVLAAEGDRPGLAVMPLGRRGDVGNLAARRIEEYLRAMIEAGSVVRLIPAATVEAGTPQVSRKRKLSKKESAALKQLDKADQAAITGREMISGGEDNITAIKLLTAAIKTYERHFIELADFTKLVDAYQNAAKAALGSGQSKRAMLYILRALTLQPTFVVDARRADKNLQTLVTRARARLARRSYGIIEVEATKPNAAVYIDGVKLGDAPITQKDLAVGKHFVQIKVKGAKPYGQVVDVKGRKPHKIHAGIVMAYDPAHDIALMVKSADVKPFADKGNYHQRIFRNYGFMFARQIRAQYLLFGAVTKSPRGIELHLFLYEAKIKRVCALKPVFFRSNLSDMQMKILEAEGHIRAAVASFPTDAEVKELPEIYTRTKKSSGIPTVRSVAAVPPPTVDPSARVVATEPAATDPKPTPSVVRRDAPQQPKKTTAAVDPYAGILKGADDEPPTGGIAGKWWFWTGVGAVVVGGGVAAYLLLNQEPAPNANFKISAFLPPAN
jgi:hypothetical protein